MNDTLWYTSLYTVLSITFGVYVTIERSDTEKDVTVIVRVRDGWKALNNNKPKSFSEFLILSQTEDMKGFTVQVKEEKIGAYSETRLVNTVMHQIFFVLRYRLK